jgi:hypothetical protein
MEATSKIAPTTIRLMAKKPPPLPRECRNIPKPTKNIRRPRVRVAAIGWRLGEIFTLATLPNIVF